MDQGREDDAGVNKMDDVLVQGSEITDDEATVMADEEEDEDDAAADDYEEEEEDDDDEGKLVIKEEPPEIPIERTEEAKIYECTTCDPPKELSNLKNYLHHLKKEHKQRVRNRRNPHLAGARRVA